MKKNLDQLKENLSKLLRLQGEGIRRVLQHDNKKVRDRILGNNSNPLKVINNK